MQLSLGKLSDKRKIGAVRIHIVYNQEPSTVLRVNTFNISYSNLPHGCAFKVADLKEILFLLRFIYDETKDKVIVLESADALHKELLAEDLSLELVVFDLYNHF